jgi:2-oxoisovalerate dehydrogenase E1 component
MPLAGALDRAALLEAIEHAVEVVRTLSRDAASRSKLKTRTEVMSSAHGIRAALGDLMRKCTEMLLFGEDVAEKGGVYGVTVGLWKAFGAGRV